MKPESNPLNDKGRSSTRRGLGWCMLALFLMFAWAGCKHEPTAAEVNPVGTFTLVSVDGKPVPCNLTHDGASMVVKSGAMIFNGDGTCTSKSVFAVPPHPDINREVKASYTREGKKLTMKWERAGITVGNLEGNKFTMNNEGMVFAYQR